MTLADDLFKNKYALTALSVQQKYRLTDGEMHILAHELLRIKEKRAQAKKEITPEHLKQIAVEWCRYLVDLRLSVVLPADFK
jgi:hypothetical protein